jgi:hypothetical protein
MDKHFAVGDRVLVFGGSGCRPFRARIMACDGNRYQIAWIWISPTGALIERKLWVEGDRLSRDQRGRGGKNQ